MFRPARLAPESAPMKFAAVSAMLIASAITLSACSGSRVVGSEYGSAYTRIEAGYAFSGRDARVELLGDPFGGDRTALEAAVVAAMRGRGNGLPTRFTTAPNETARPGSKIVFAFNPVGTEPTSKLCTPNGVATAPARPGESVNLYVEAAFCSGGGAANAARGWLDGATGPDAAGFDSLIGDLTDTLLQPSEVDRCLLGDC